MRRIAIYALPLALLALAGCKKEDSLSIPTLYTNEVKIISPNTVESGGTLIVGDIANLTYEGLCWSTSPNPTIKDSICQFEGLGNSFSCVITGLKTSTTYYLRAYATNSAGTGYGNELSFDTPPMQMPMLKITDPINITRTSVMFYCEVTSDGGGAPAHGVCWSTSENPTISDSKTVDGTGKGAFTSTITGLTPNTTYYVRVYATNEAGTTYGNSMPVRTMNSTVTDIDGNIYQTVLIGNQEWMAENLKVTHYRNGDVITEITNPYDCSTLVTGGYSYYMQYAGPVFKIFGPLYNWYAVADSRNIAPEGWHVATDAEWSTLITYLGGPTLASPKLNVSKYPYSNNSSGFTANLGGRCNSTFCFEGLYNNGYWWTSSPSALGYLINFNAVTRHSVNKKYGYSIRCVKD